MTRFVGDVGDLKLSKIQTERISNTIQRAVLGHLADDDGWCGTPPFVIHFPHPWPGLILRPNIDQVMIAEKALEKTLAAHG